MIDRPVRRAEAADSTANDLADGSSHGWVESGDQSGSSPAVA
jgi:hypothetical protein